jgi:Zn-dependent M16 (insulinase) family peptidase
MLQHVLKVLSFDYLWNEIRVQGGAYGTGLINDKIGNIIFYSYRDPSVVRSIDIYKKTIEFIHSF